MTANGKLLPGIGSEHIVLDLRYANRHGLIAGANGTGKAITPRLMRGIPGSLKR